MGLLDKLSYVDVSRSAYVAKLFLEEIRLEKRWGIFQTPQQKVDSYSYRQGSVSLLIKTSLSPFAAMASFVEGVARLFLSGLFYLASLRRKSLRELSENLWESALSFDRTEMSALEGLFISIAFPASELVTLLSQIGKRYFLSHPVN
ncbi:MAG TPA: hypothetical protein DCY54_01540 [Parachlamydiales bacterium]|nr:MAG: hypothetical protein A3D18_05705 [Chlamydiae bacterium RIFCSPHIGHO2_02_FULL_49_29]OGN62642.1 MAG: hypothetical protein A3E26_04225 [Chlamydiae bacterium RIFCSPHIGHO2_12_FULL_49_32]OGN70868.1 MAG: hypothetical protein A3I15_06550 [Chlamydiae bacterium RIFCSPLOWO2_02_FULL_49_12]OGN71331.1 MAG: hypothetical protein A3G30_03190 [Chlamydiae bacterium RIFCSPLOWO2_12_FULL_49_12]HAZ15318.1 hypothetical protein [Parachlamydiales bacterium]